MSRDKQKKVTMRDIAKANNVSAVTVSKALAGKEGVGEELRAQIIRSADELGYSYTPNNMKGSSQPSSSGNLGVLVADRFFSDNSFYFSLYRVLMTKAAKHGYNVVLEIVSENDERKKTIPQIIRSSKVDGIIFLGEFLFGYLENLSDCGLPFIFLDFYSDKINADAITSNSVFGSFTLTESLFESGHKKIAFVGSVNDTSSIMDRFLGYTKSLVVHGSLPRADWIIPDRGEDGIILETIPLPKDMPEAFVCNCDETAYVLIRSLAAAGYRVPEDVSVVGFDDFALATHVNPPLTTYRVDVDLMGETAVDMLMRKIKGMSFTRGITVISGQPVFRESVAKR